MRWHARDPVKFYVDRYLPSIYEAKAFQNRQVMISATSGYAHPAFVTKTSADATVYSFLPSFSVSRFQNQKANDIAISQKGVDPAQPSIQNALLYSQNKGTRWHLMTAAEWAAIALWCKTNNTKPLGNSDSGKDSSETEYVAIPVGANKSDEITRVATGTGPVTWSHNHREDGIWDLKGNVWEWCAGARLVNGELQVLPFNMASNTSIYNNSNYDQMSAGWKCISATANTMENLFVDPSVSGGNPTGNTANVLHLAWNSGSGKFVWQSSMSQLDSNKVAPFKDVSFDGSVTSGIAKEYVRALCLAPEEQADSSVYGSAIFRANLSGTRYMRRGGFYRITGSDIFAVDFFNDGTTETGTTGYTDTGFRAVYAPAAQ